MFEMLAPKIYEDRFNLKFVRMSADAFLAKDVPINVVSFKDTRNDMDS